MVEPMAPDRLLVQGPKQQPKVDMIPIIAGAPSWAIPSKLREMSAGHAAPGSAPVLLSAIFLVAIACCCCCYCCCCYAATVVATAVVVAAVVATVLWLLVLLLLLLGMKRKEEEDSAYAFFV